MEIITVIESLNQLRESPEFESCQLCEKRQGVLDERASERAKLPERESEDLVGQAAKLAKAIEELSGEALSRIQ